MSPSEAHDLIREACMRRPELRQKDCFYEKNKGKNYYSDKFHKQLGFKGYCYVASHAFYVLVPEAKIYRSLDREHFFNKIEDEVWDLTKEQFEAPLDYSQSICVPRKSNPTKRVQELLVEVNKLS